MTEQLPLCECGCGERVTKPENRFILGHNNRRERYWKTQQEPKLCECGCGKFAKPGNRIINGHDKCRLGVEVSQEAKDRMSESAKGKRKSPAHRAAMKEAWKLRPSFSDDRIANMSESHKNSEAMEIQAKKMRGGLDIVNHHYLYDHSDLSLNTVKMTRSDHSRLHWLLWRLGVYVPHINRQ